MSIARDIREQFRNGQVLMQLILINIGVFLLLHLFRLLLILTGSKASAASADLQALINWLAMPYEPWELLKKPWTLITHAFLHYDIAHIFWNMVILYVFGTLMRHFGAEKKILSTYIFASIVGGLISFAGLYFLEGYRQSILMGASGGVMGIMLAATTLRPNQPMQMLLIGQVKIKYIAAVIVLIDLIGLSYMRNIGGHYAHLGGALTGWWLIREAMKGRDWSAGFNRFFYALRNLLSPRGRPKKTRLRVKHRTAAPSSRPISDEEYNHIRAEKQKKIDQILDKISRNGYESLTRDEKDFLFNSSKDG